MNLAAIVMAASLSVPALAATYQGEYRSSSFSDVSATLTVTRADGGWATTLRAPQADCVVRFGTGVYAGRYDGQDVYELPVLEACDSPHASTFRLFIDAMNAKIRGTNGRMSWTYFSGRRRSS